MATCADAARRWRPLGGQDHTSNDARLTFPRAAKNAMKASRTWTGCSTRRFAGWATSRASSGKRCPPEQVRIREVDRDDVVLVRQYGPRVRNRFRAGGERPPALEDAMHDRVDDHTVLLKRDDYAAADQPLDVARPPKRGVGVEWLGERADR